MKNKFKLLPLAICGALYVGESYADENFTTPNFSYSISGIPVAYREADEAALAWINIHNKIYADCLSRVQEMNLEEYSCKEFLFHDFRAVETTRLINGNRETYLMNSTYIDHLVFRNPETGEIDTNDIVSVGNGVAIYLNRACPEGTFSRSFNVTSESLDQYCVYRDQSIDNSSSIGNPINYISRQKHDFKNDFVGRESLNLSRFYVNQLSGWSLRDTLQIVDLYNISVGDLVTVDSKNEFVTEYQYNEETINSPFDVTSSIITRPLLYTIPAESYRKVLVSDQYGITQSFLGGPTIFKSTVDSSQLIYTPEDGEVAASWKLVSSNGVQQFFNNVGEMTEIRYPNGDIIFYQYDNNSRVIKKENKLGDYIAYEYDGSGNTVKATVMPENIVFDYIYETIETGTYPNRLIEVKQDQVVTLRYQYDDLTYPLAMTSVTGANDVVLARWGYAVNGDATLTSPNNEDIFSINYARSISGPRTVGSSEVFLGSGPEIINPNGSTTSYVISRLTGYDRVIATVDRSVDGASVQAEFFTYDSLGNANTETNSNGDVTYKAYDANRFLIRESKGYRWNNEVARYSTLSNPLSSLVGTEIETTNFCWDSNTGLRTKIITDDLVTTFVYSELGQIINTIEEPANSTNNTCN